MNINAKMKEFSNKGFSKEQLWEIRLGLEDNVDA